MKSHLKIWGVIVLFFVGATQALGQTGAGNLQTAAEEALIAGDPMQTETLAQAMIAENPDSFAGHFLLALALSDLGRHSDAAKSAGRAYRHAPTEDDKLQSARLAGSSRFVAEQYARSELWLRRAANHVDTEQEAERVVREFQRAQAANPISLSFGGQITPSSNVNNGSENATFRLEGIDIDFALPPERLALAGTIFSANAQMGYTLSESASQTTSVNGYIYGKTVELTPEAQATVPSLPSSAFDLYIAQVSLSHQRQIIDGLGPTGVSLTMNRLWSRDSELSTGQILKLQQIIPLDDSSFVTISGSRNRQDGLVGGVQIQGIDTGSSDETIDFSDGYDLSASYATTLANADSLSISLTKSLNDGGFENVSTEYRGKVDYDVAERFLNIRWSVAAELGYRYYDEFSLSLDGRRDRFGSLSATGVFQGVSYFGFSPGMTFSANRTLSDVDIFTTSKFEARFGISSNF